MSAATEWETYELLRSERRWHKAASLALVAARVCAVIILIGLTAAVTVVAMDDGGSVRGVFDQ